MPQLDAGSLDLDETTYVGSTHWRASANRLVNAAGSEKQFTQGPSTSVNDSNGNNNSNGNISTSTDAHTNSHRQSLHPVNEAPQLLFSHHPAYSKRQVLEGLPSRPTADRLVLLYFNSIMLGRRKATC